MNHEEAIADLIATCSAAQRIDTKVRLGIVLTAIAVVILVVLVFAPGRGFHWNGEDSRKLSVEQAWKAVADEDLDKDSRIAAALQLKNIACRASYALWQAEASNSRPLSEKAKAYREQVRDALDR